jgi:adenylylsulfate kinase-like enzyme
MNRVTITISAGPNQGKTTIARLIEEALREKGFSSVEVLDTKDSSSSKLPVAQRFEETKKRPVTIKVNTVHQEAEETNSGKRAVP